MAQFRFNTISRTDIESSLGGSQMIRAIDYDGPNNLIVSGCPGSGKTTVSIMRAERIVNSGRDVLVVTYQDLLRTSLVNIASENLERHIVGFYSWYSRKFEYLKNVHTAEDMIKKMEDWHGIDEVIVDEGQDFEARIYKALLKKCKRLTVGADNAQKIHSRGLKSDQIQKEIEAKGKVLSIHLQYNYRNTYEIYNFARFFLPYNERANNYMAIDKMPKGKGPLPTVFLVPDYNTRLYQLNILLSNAGNRNTAILLYGIDEVDEYYNIVSSLGYACSKHHSDDHIGSKNIENILITTFKSAKGLEFQVVIMPNMETALEDKYRTPEHYYIACTRAKENLFLLTQGVKLPRYFNDFEQNSYTFRKIDKTPPPKLQGSFSEQNDDLPF